jgi:hypothetical protein
MDRAQNPEVRKRKIGEEKKRFERDKEGWEKKD